MRSPNVIVLGGISYAKSTLIKTYIYRQYLFGRQAWVIDVKGEYGPLAAALGRRTIRLEPGGEVRLNPIERRGGREGQLAFLQVFGVVFGLLPEADDGEEVGLVDPGVTDLALSVDADPDVRDHGTAGRGPDFDVAGEIAGVDGDVGVFVVHLGLLREGFV
jgi:hypothetical protein